MVCLKINGANEIVCFKELSQSNGLFEGIEQCQKCAPGGTSRCVVVGKVDLKNLSSTKFRCECRTPYFEGNGVTCTSMNSYNVFIYYLFIIYYVVHFEFSSASNIFWSVA